MALTPVQVATFGGLDLLTDIHEGGPSRCMDMLNIEHPLGRIKTRDGYNNFTSSANTSRFQYVAPYYTTSGTKQLLVTTAAAQTTNALVAYSTAGAVVADVDPGGTGNKYGRPVQFGSPTGEVAYIPFFLSVFGGGLVGAKKWNGSAFSDPTGVATDFDLLAVQMPDNRLVGARQTAGTTSISKVGFSAAGDAETYNSTDDNVFVSPGDGEMITALVSWGNLMFVFKETKFAVFYGNSVDSTGGSVFNFRMVNNGVGCIGSLTSSGPACAGTNGVYFLNRRGVYVTTGGEPVLVSRQLDPLFSGDLPDVYLGSAINQAQVAGLADMCWIGERLYVAVPTGSNTYNDTLLVWDSLTDEWLVWQFPDGAGGVCGFRKGDNAELHFSYATGSNHIGRQSSEFTDDDGLGISWHWRSGWFDMSGRNAQAFTRRSALRGTGNAILEVFTDYVNSDSNSADLTLSNTAAPAEVFHNVAYKGTLWSHKLSKSVNGSQAEVDSLTHWLSHVRGDAERD